MDQSISSLECKNPLTSIAEMSHSENHSSFFNRKRLSFLCSFSLFSDYSDYIHTCNVFFTFFSLLSQASLFWANIWRVPLYMRESIALWILLMWSLVRQTTHNAYKNPKFLKSSSDEFTICDLLIAMTIE